MRGSVYRRGTAWQLQLEMGRDPETGERVRKYIGGFRTRKDAQAELARLLSSMNAGTFVEPSELTVAAYLLTEWLPHKQPADLRRVEHATAAGEALPTRELPPRGDPRGRRHRGQVSHAAYRDYEATCRNHVVPRIGQLRLQAVTGQSIDALLDELEARGLSPKTVRNIYGTVHTALEDAVRWGRIGRNPCRSVRPPTAGRSPFGWWEIDELRAFIDAVHEHEYVAGWMRFVTTGCAARRSRG